MQLPAVPSMRDVQAWDEPASEDLVTASVTQVFTDVQMGASPGLIGRTVVLVSERGYTAAEIAYAVQEMKYDQALDKKLSFPDGELSAADFDRVVSDLRRLRHALTMQLRMEDVNRWVERFPNLLSVDDFGICGYTSAETPLYRFSFTGTVKERRPMPQLIEREDPGSERERTAETSPVALGSLIEVRQ